MSGKELKHVLQYDMGFRSGLFHEKQDWVWLLYSVQLLANNCEEILSFFNIVLYVLKTNMNLQRLHHVHVSVIKNHLWPVKLHFRVKQVKFFHLSRPFVKTS